MAQYKTRDPHNPYRTGVLVGNYVEDKFGAEFAVREVSLTLFIFDKLVFKFFLDSQKLFLMI